MGTVRTWEIIQGANVTLMPSCTQNLTSPAIVFSTGGYRGNNFHDFNDILLPLYMTAGQFNGTVIFLVTNIVDWWILKHKTILDNLSNYIVMDIDTQNEVLCFTKVIIGLKVDKDMSTHHPSPPHYYMLDFAQFLRSTYSLERESIDDFRGIRLPRMLIISRQDTRHITNEGEVVDVAKSVGFDVAVKEMGHNIYSNAQLLNSHKVMVGVVGAGLTNMLFLPKGEVVIQIVLFGLEILPHYFDLPPKDLNLRYIGYNVNLNESSLFGKYPLDSEAFTDPGAIMDRGYQGFKSIYMDNQDANLDLSKFRETLLKAKELLEM